MMRKLIVIMLLCSTYFAHAQLSPTITSWIQNPDTFLAANRGYANIPSNCIKIQYSTTDVYVSCFCIPGYNIGPWNNPNVAENQNFCYKKTLNPQKETGTPTSIPLGHIGVLSNGVEY